MLRLLLPLLLLLAGPALGQRLVSQTTTPAAGQLVVLELRYAHTIRVRPGTGPELRVQAQVTIADGELDRSYSLAVTTSSAPGELRVEERLDKQMLTHYWRGKWNDRRNVGTYDHDDTALRIDYEVTLPAAQPLRVITTAADIDAENLTGDLRLSTISGDLRLADLRGAVQARTVSGDIHLRGLAGTAPVDALTVSGDVDASWPPARAAELSLKSLSGEVYADPAVTFNNLHTRSFVGYELRGQVAGGNGPQVSLHTVSGDVFFRQQ